MDPQRVTATECKWASFGLYPGFGLKAPALRVTRCADCQHVTGHLRPALTYQGVEPSASELHDVEHVSPFLLFLSHDQQIVFEPAVWGTTHVEILYVNSDVPSCCLTIMLSCNPIVMLLCHYAALPLGHLAVMPLHCLAIMVLCHFAILPLYR